MICNLIHANVCEHNENQNHDVRQWVTFNSVFALVLRASYDRDRFCDEDGPSVGISYCDSLPSFNGMFS